MASDKRALDELDALFRGVPAEAVCSSSRPAAKLRDGGKVSPRSTVTKPRSSAKRKRGGGVGTGGSNDSRTMFAAICFDGQLVEEIIFTVVLTDESCCRAKLPGRTLVQYMCCNVATLISIYCLYRVQQ